MAVIASSLCDRPADAERRDPLGGERQRRPASAKQCSSSGLSADDRFLFGNSESSEDQQHDHLASTGERWKRLVLLSLVEWHNLSELFEVVSERADGFELGRNYGHKVEPESDRDVLVDGDQVSGEGFSN